MMVPTAEAAASPPGVAFSRKRAEKNLDSGKIDSAGLGLATNRLIGIGNIRRARR